MDDKQLNAKIAAIAAWAFILSAGLFTVLAYADDSGAAALVGIIFSGIGIVLAFVAMSLRRGNK